MSEETKYTDPTGLDKVDYDQEQVSPEVKKHAKNVRTKMYGRHVRESIARAIEFIDLTAQSALNFAKKAFSKSEDTENRLDNQIRDLTSDSEIIDFRYSSVFKKTFNILKDRGDFWDKEIVLKNGVSIAWFEETISKTAFKQAIEFAQLHNISNVFIPNGEFDLNNEILPRDINLFGSGSIYSILKSKEGASGLRVEPRNNLGIQGFTLEGHYDTMFSEDTYGLRIEGGASSAVLNDVTIKKYKVLLDVKDSLFSSSFNNLRLLQGETHIRVRNGFNIVLNFNNLFSNQAHKTHIDAQNSALNFFGGNFGGLINHDKSQKFAVIESDFFTNFYGCNFEGIMIEDFSEALLFKGKQHVSFDNCTMQILITTNNLDGFYIRATDEVKLTFKAPNFLNINTNKIKPIAIEKNVTLDTGDSNTPYVITDLIDNNTGVKSFRRTITGTGSFRLGDTNYTREILFYPSVNIVIRRLIITALREVKLESNMPRITITQGSTSYLDMKIPAIKEGDSVIFRDNDLKHNYVKEWNGPLVVYSENNKKYAENDMISVGIEYYVL